ncbi:hypothetical protein GRJ2_003129200 [Grus japonensis]|uniref:Uncharacterized protein n=1 Tax=Grus japonensis TaxID=30415 RepID=A0ABC9Y9M6_GRUJA
MERGIQYLRELAMREMVYYDPDNAQLPTDPDEVQCTRPMWRKFVRSAPSSYANSLAVINWKSEEAPRVDEVAGRLQQYEESLSSSLLWFYPSRQLSTMQPLAHSPSSGWGRELEEFK